MKIIVLLLIASVASAQLQVSSNKRYLKTPDGTPVLLNGESSWDLFSRVSYTDARRYIDTLAALGVNFVCARIMSPPQIGGPVNINNVYPWIGTQTFASPINEPYWLHVDSVMDYLLAKGVYVQIFPDYLGYDGTQGFSDETGNSTVAVMKSWGQFIGSRYGRYTNVLWGIGGDTDPTTWHAELDSMISGIVQYSSAPMSPRDEMGSNADTHWSTNDRITMNYTYQYASGWEYRDIRTCAGRSPAKVFIWAEGAYENEAPKGHTTTTAEFQREMYWPILWGATGHLFGNCPLWNFGNFSGFSACDGVDWKTQLTSTGQVSLRWFGKVMRNRHWWTLIPDTNNTVLTAGQGSYDNYDDDIAICGFASDSTTIMVFVCHNYRDITVTSAGLKGDSTRAWWYNPSDGTSIDLGTQSRASHTYTVNTVPRLLVLDAKSMNYPPPGVDVQTNAPGPPALSTPSNGATGVATNPTLMWNASPGATWYRVQVSTSAGFTSTVADQDNIAGTSLTVSGLVPGAQYYWRVNASNAGGTSSYSTAWNFTTSVALSPPAPPVLATPADGATGVSATPTLTWNPSTGTTSYRIQVSANSGFTTILVDQSGITSTSWPIGGLANNTQYYWHVNATNNAGSSAYSTPYTFTTGGPPTGLVAAYSFDEGTGTTVADASGHGLTGTISGATWTTGGKYSNALSFNGTSSYVDLGNPSLLQITGSMTLSAWVKAMADPPDDGQIIAKSDNNSGWQLKTSPDTGPQTFGVAVSGGSSAHTQRYSSTTRGLNTWYHIAGVYNAAAQTLSVYVNGVLDNGTLLGSVPALQFNANLNVNIGRRSGGFYFNGTIDEVRIYDRALTQAEIQSDMNTPLGAPAPLPPSPPVLVTPADGANGVLTNPTLVWNTSTGATSYRVQVSTDPGFTATVADQGNIAGTSLTVSGLAANTQYYWRVNATNNGGTSAYSATSSFATVAALQGLVASYAFNEGTGATVADASGNGLLGTISGAGWTTTGKYGDALSFNGVNSYVDLLNPMPLSLTGSMTLSAWVNATADPADDGQIIAKSDNTSGWMLKTSPDTGPTTFAIAVSTNGTSHTQRYSTTVRSLNTWYHVAGVYNASAKTLDIYVNGNLDNGILVGTIPSLQFNPGLDVNIGRRSGGFYFNGIIDEVHVYNRALSQGEIQTDMNTSSDAVMRPTIAGIEVQKASSSILVAWTKKNHSPGNVSVRSSNEGGDAESAQATGLTTLKVTAAGGGIISYRWQRDDADIPGAHGSAYALGVSDVAKSITLRCIVSNSSGADTTSEVTISTNSSSMETIAPGGGNKLTSIPEETVPEKYALDQNYPNPFNPSTTIRFQIRDRGFVLMKVFDILGRETTTLVNQILSPGSYQARFDGSNLPSGIYICRLETGNYSDSRKMVLAK